MTTYTLAFGSVAFCIPKGFRNGLLSTKLRHSTIDCHSFHDGDNTVFLLAAVHVEQHFECTSCHTRFLFTKLNINELDIDTQTGDKRCNSIYHMLNLTLSRVMICKPSFFLNLLFLRIPIFRLVIIWNRNSSDIKLFSVISPVFFSYSRDFFVSLVDFWRPPNHVYYSRRTHYATPVIQHVPRLSNTDHNTKETNPKVCKHIVFTSLIGLQHITFIFKIKWFILRQVGVMELQHVTFILKLKSYICVTLKEQNSQINVFNKRNLYNITNCVLQRFAL